MCVNQKMILGLYDVKHENSNIREKRSQYSSSLGNAGASLWYVIWHISIYQPISATENMYLFLLIDIA